MIEQVAGRAWNRDDGAAMKVGRCLIDAGYVPDLVFQAIRLSPHVGVVMPSRGIGIGARNKPLSEYQRKRGEQYGHHWLDGIVGCAVAASMLGVALFAQEAIAKRKKRPDATVSYL